MEEIENLIITAHWDEQKHKWLVYDSDRDGINRLWFDDEKSLLDYYGKAGWAGWDTMNEIDTNNPINKSCKFYFKRIKRTQKRY